MEFKDTRSEGTCYIVLPNPSSLISYEGLDKPLIVFQNQFPVCKVNMKIPIF